MKLALSKFTRRLAFFFAILVIAAFLVMPVLAQGETPPEVPGLELTAQQLVLVGLITSALVAFVRLLIELLSKQNLALPDWVMQAIVYAVSGGVAYLWFPPTLPALPTVPPGSELPDIVALYNTYISTLLTALSAFFVVAHLFYRWFIKKVRENLIRKLVSPAR